MVDTEIGSDRAPRGIRASASVRELGPDEAFAFLCEQLADGCAESGRLILVSGNVASGKTQLLGDLLDIAAREGVRALSATGAAEEQALAGGVIDQLLTGPDLPQTAVELAERIIEAYRGPALGRPAGEPEVTRATAHLLWRLAQELLDLAREKPMVIVVDNVHLADRTSVLLLQHLHRRLRSTMLTIVLSLRDRPQSAGPHRHFTHHPHHHVRLTPLSEHAVRDLLGGRVSDAFSSLIHELSAGNPMLVNSLIADYLSTGDIGEPAAAGSAFAEAVVSYLDRWDLPLREVAGAIAVFGVTISTDVIATLTGIATGVAEEVSEALTRSGLMADGWFRHAVTESAALGGLSPQARASAHLRAAELKFQQVVPPKEVAAHLIAAGSAKAHWASTVLRKAAEQAAADAEVDFARQCLELALTSATTNVDRRSILGLLARYSWCVSPSASRRYVDSLRGLPSDGAAAGGAEAATVARKALWQGDEAAYRSGWEAMAGSVDAQTETRLLLAYEWWFGPAGTGLPARLPSDDPWRMTATALSGIWRQAGNDASTAAADRILRNCGLADDSLEALLTALLALVYDNKMEAAETWWRCLEAEAGRRGAVTWQAVLSGMWSGAVLRGGDAWRAAELARHALSLLPVQDWEAAIGDPLTTLLLVYTAAGEYDRAAEILTHHVPDSMYRTVAGIRYIRARGQYHLATGRLLAAVSDFTECGRLLADHGNDLAVIAPWRADLAAANLALGNLDIAGELAAQQLELAAETDGYTRGLSLRVLALAGEPVNLRKTLGQAIEKFGESGDRWEARRTSEMLERLQRRGIAPGDAEVPATEEPEQDPHGGDVLSAAEMRVAELAALRLTNQEISSILFITVSTVEQHLTRVYRKLGIRSRTSLAAKLGASEARSTTVHHSVR